MSGFPLMGLSTRPRGNVMAQQLPLMGLSTRPRDNVLAQQLPLVGLSTKDSFQFYRRGSFNGTS